MSARDRPRAKITEADVKSIDRLRNEGLTYREIAEIFTISVVQVHRIVKRVAWRHVPVNIDVPSYLSVTPPAT